MSDKPLTYKDAGVDIDAGSALVERIKPAVAATRRPEVMAGLGGFGGLFALPPERYKEPVLVSGTDGVGTKLMLAQQLQSHSTIGIDLVAMCVNDVLVQGAEPLFFLDYFACGHLDVDVAADVISGIADGCKQAGAALIGGETAEMPDMYSTGEYDLAGFCVGAVERADIIDGEIVLVQGAEPLFFLDYFACGHLDVDVAADVISGIADGCKQAGAALIGGETAEMPDMYSTGEYDLAGFCVGAVERADIIDGSSIAAGDALIGIASSGPHSNGYSLIRKVLQRTGEVDIGDKPASVCLLTPTRIYVKAILALMQALSVKGLAHITGGGLTENIPRILDDSLHAEIDTGSWQQGEVFDWLATNGNIDVDEMRRTFNCGVGMIVVVANGDVDAALSALSASGESAWQIGHVAAGAGEVNYF